MVWGAASIAAGSIAIVFSRMCRCLPIRLAGSGIKKPSFPKFSPKKSKKASEGTITVEETIERTPMDNDPIMEDREDAPVEQAESESSTLNERYQDDERSPVADETTEKPADDEDSVMTEVKDANADDALSTVKEEPSKEEAEAIEEEEEKSEHPISVIENNAASIDDTLTLDATATVNDVGPECTSPPAAPAFCGCFSN